MQMCTCSCQMHNIRKYSRGVNGWSVFQENISSEPSDTNTKTGLQARIHERFTDHTNPLWYVKAQWRPLPPLKISIVAAFVTFLKVLPAISRSGSERRLVCESPTDTLSAALEVGPPFIIKYYCIIPKVFGDGSRFELRLWMRRCELQAVELQSGLEMLP